MDVNEVFQVDGESPASYMRRNLKPVKQPQLANSTDPCPVFYNVVSNVKLDPPGPQPLLKLLSLYPNAEIKSGFGAAILRFMHTLNKDQCLVPQLKPSSVTHLCFAKGALGSTGNRSVDEARLGCHEFRMSLYSTFGIRTNFRRFTIPNMVCSSSLGYCVDLAKMWTGDRFNRSYFPELFPGLFLCYKHVYPERQAIHQNLLEGDSEYGHKKVQLLEDDLIQLHKNSKSTSKNESEEALRSQIKGMLDSYLPKFKCVMVLVFVEGKVVGLGVHDQEIGKEAFKYAARMTKDYIISEDQVAEYKKKRKAQNRLERKNKVMQGAETRVNYSRPFSKDARKKLEQIVNTVEDEREKEEQIKQVLEDDKKKKTKKRVIDEDMDDIFEDMGNDFTDRATNKQLGDMDFDFDNETDSTVDNFIGALAANEEDIFSSLDPDVINSFISPENSNASFTNNSPKKSKKKARSESYDFDMDSYLIKAESEKVQEPIEDMPDVFV